jgi:hypothetical protein
MTAGASKYPKFAIITKVTPTGKFRLAYYIKYTLNPRIIHLENGMSLIMVTNL